MLNVSVSKDAFITQINTLVEEGHGLIDAHKDISSTSRIYIDWENRIRSFIEMRIYNFDNTLFDFDVICSKEEINPLINRRQTRKHRGYINYSPLVNKINKIISFLEDLSKDDIHFHVDKKTGYKNGNHSSDSKIFIVHGHEHNYKHDLCRTLEVLQLYPVVLQDQANEGKTIIEKFEKHSDVGFAIILLTDDDNGKSKKEKNLKPRARQNVILEMGYFIGRLGRSKVIILHSENVELPSDIIGLGSIPIDIGGDWKIKLLKELKAAKFVIDSNNLF